MKHAVLPFYRVLRYLSRMDVVQRFIGQLVSALITLFSIALLTFILMKLIPGGPFDNEKKQSAEVLAAQNAKHHLDLPAHEQFYLFMKDAVTKFDFGQSTKHPTQSVNDIIRESLPVSIELGIYALIVAVTLGISLGVLAAAKRGTWLDFSAMFAAISGVSLPSFMMAAIAILIFSQYLQILPAALWDAPEHRILPTLVLGLRPAAIIARLTRSSVLEVLYLDYVRTARAKGLHPLRVLFIHVLRNALVPVIAILGPMSAAILTGSFIVEYVFSVPGLAAHYIDAVSNRDYNLIMGVTLLYAVFLVAINLLVDVIYGIVDPRMRKGMAS